MSPNKESSEGSTGPAGGIYKMKVFELEWKWDRYDYDKVNCGFDRHRLPCNQQNVLSQAFCLRYIFRFSCVSKWLFMVCHSNLLAASFNQYTMRRSYTTGIIVRMVSAAGRVWTALTENRPHWSVDHVWKKSELWNKRHGCYQYVYVFASGWLKKTERVASLFCSVCTSVTAVTDNG